MENNEAIILRIKELMDYLSLKQIEFARACEIEQANLSAVMTGKRNIGMGVINKILLAFNVNKEWILHGTGERFRSSNRPNDDRAPYGAKVSNEVNVYEAVNTLSQTNKDLVNMIHQVVEDKRSLEVRLCNLVDKVISK